MACFDTSFQRSNPDLVRQFAPPAELHNAGLRGMSGLSNDISTLLDCDDPGAALALELYVQRIGRELGSLAAAPGEVDAIVFTGGNGENPAPICERVMWNATLLG